MCINVIYDDDLTYWFRGHALPDFISTSAVMVVYEPLCHNASVFHLAGPLLDARSVSSVLQTSSWHNSLLRAVRSRPPSRTHPSAPKGESAPSKRPKVPHTGGAGGDMPFLQCKGASAENPEDLGRLKPDAATLPARNSNKTQKVAHAHFRALLEQRMSEAGRQATSRDGQSKAGRHETSTFAEHQQPAAEETYLRRDAGNAILAAEPHSPCSVSVSASPLSDDEGQFALKAASLPTNLADTSPDPLPPPAPHWVERPTKRLRKETPQPTTNDNTSGNQPCSQTPPSCEAEARGHLVEKREEQGWQYLVRCMPCDVSNDPRAKLESAIFALAAELRDNPTLPSDSKDASQPMEDALRDDMAPLLPPKHCGFKGCMWTLPWPAKADAGSERHRETELVSHIKDAHLDLVAPVVDLLPTCFSPHELFAAAYNEALGVKVRQGAPLASYAIDRKCLRKASEATSGDNMEALICFFCACIHPHRSGLCFDYVLLAF